MAENINIFIDMVRDTKLAPNDVFVDIGANIGQELSLLAKYGIKMYSYEPHPVFFAHLQKQYSMYPNVELHNVAITNFNGTIGLYCQNTPTEINAGASIKRKRNCLDTPSYTVKTLKASDEVKRLINIHKRIKVFTMDIEGSEYDVLEDLLDNNLMDSIDFLYFEDHHKRILDEKYETKRVEILKRLEDKNIRHKPW